MDPRDLDRLKYHISSGFPSNVLQAALALALLVKYFGTFRLRVPSCLSQRTWSLANVVQPGGGDLTKVLSGGLLRRTCS